MPSIVVRLDRRAEVLSDVRGELQSLRESVGGLAVSLADDGDIAAARDSGKYRDFVDVATLTHEDDAVLEWVAEELVDEFGWLVDIQRG